MNEDTWQLVEAVGQAMRDGRSRTEVIEQMVDAGHQPQTAQNVVELARRWRVGQGDFGYGEWFWSIMSGKAVRARGATGLWLATLPCVFASLPLTFALVVALPPGRYPVILLALPALLAGGIGAYAVGALVFQLARR